MLNLLAAAVLVPFGARGEVTLPAQGDREADCFRPSAGSGVQVP
ncbi:hypothetical protein [Deinococcus actinosclerus]|nr:hypothetical protein [Deinococcus actinosclerus]